MTPAHDAARCVPGDPRFDRWYRAIDARDARFDGQFFTAVASTGIYCRPSCPARTPKPENVAFYLTSAAAHEAGYRACKRCLPEAAPGTPEWDLRGDLAGRAMRLIADGVVDREGVEGLAGRLGYSPRQVHRTLTAELGAGPLSLARARRAQTARSLLVGTGLPLADIAFAAGFGSVRQFNDTVREVFDTTPGELRARAPRARAGGLPGTEALRPGAADLPATEVRGAGRGGARANRRGPDGRDAAAGTSRPGSGSGADGAAARPGAEPGAAAGRPSTASPVTECASGPGVGQGTHRDWPGALAPVRLALNLPVRRPYDAPGVFGFLAARAVTGVESADLPAGGPLRYARTLHLPHGPGAVEVTAMLAPDGWRLSAGIELTSLADVGVATARVRRLLDLDADPLAVDAALSADPVLARLVAAVPGLRVPGAVDPEEMVLRAMVGQQISVAAARGHLSRLAARIGTPVVSSFAGLDRLFPTAAQVADALDGAGHSPGRLDPDVERGRAGGSVPPGPRPFPPDPDPASSPGVAHSSPDAGPVPGLGRRSSPGPGPDSSPGRTRPLPPDPRPAPSAGLGQLSALDPDRPLRLPGRSVAAIRDTAAALADGSLRVDVGASTADLTAALVARSGIGPWTAGYLAMRVLGDPDVWLPGDAALLTSARALGIVDPGLPRATAHRALTARSADWAPWRSYAVTHLWRVA